MGFDAHKGPFFSTLFFVTGVFLSRKKADFFSLRYGGMIAVFGLLLHFSEVIYLRNMWQVYTVSNEFLVGTYFLGLGIAIMALSNHKAVHNNFLAKVGKYTLGIYVVHYIYVDLLKSIDRTISHPIWEVGYVILVLMLSWIIAFYLSKIHFLKKVFR